jgi:hypothetical protein
MARQKAKPRARGSSRPRPAAGQVMLEALYEVQAEVQALILLLVMKGTISPAELDAAIENSRGAMEVEKAVNPEIAASYAELKRLADVRRGRRRTSRRAAVSGPRASQRRSAT